MDISQFNPYVRYIDKRNAGTEYKEAVAAYDHRLFFVSSGKLKVFLESGIKTLCENQCVIIPPAMGYKIVSGAGNEYYVLNFDFIFDGSLVGIKPIRPDILPAFSEDRIISHKTSPMFPLFLSSPAGTDETFAAMFDRFTKKDFLYAESISSLLKSFVTESLIFTRYDRTPENIKKLLSYLSKHYLESVSNSDIAEAFSFHPNHLGRVFKEYTGKTIHSHIIELRLQKAYKLLLTTELPVARIAEMCSFESYAYFIKCFKKHFGSSPGKYRRDSSKML